MNTATKSPHSSMASAGFPYVTTPIDLTPIDGAGPVIGPDVAGCLDDATPSAPRPGAGQPAGYPLAFLFTRANDIACRRFFPGSPLTPEELGELHDAAQAVEEYYGPDLSGPWLIWARLGMSLSAIYLPRAMEQRRKATATPGGDQ